MDTCELYQSYQACCYGCDTIATVSDLMQMFDLDKTCCLSVPEFIQLVEYVQANVDSNYLIGIPP